MVTFAPGFITSNSIQEDEGKAAVRTVRTEFNPSKNIRGKQRNLLSVDNDMQFTDR